MTGTALIRVPQLVANLVGFTVILLAVIWSLRGPVGRFIARKMDELDRLSTRVFDLGEKFVDLGHELNDTNSRLTDVAQQLVHIVQRERDRDDLIAEIRDHLKESRNTP